MKEAMTPIESKMELEPDLTAKEKKRFEELEGIIERNFKAFIEVGLALKEIHDSRLYRKTALSFSDYCRDLWEMSKANAYRLIDAADVVGNLLGVEDADALSLRKMLETAKTSPMGDVLKMLPANERQARELAKLPPEDQAETWERIVNLANNTEQKITAKLVKKAVKEYKGEQLEDLKEKVKKEASRHNRNDFESEKFTEAFSAFVDQINVERLANWRYTSRSTVHRYLLGLLDIVGGLPDKIRDEYACSMELSDREKLRDAGFNIFRMDVKNKLIEEWKRNDFWVVVSEHPNARALQVAFKKLLENRKCLRG